MEPKRTRITASGGSSCSAVTSRRMAATTSDQSLRRVRSTSATTIRRSRPCRSTAKAATSPALIRGLAIHAANNDQVFQTSGDEELAVVEEAKVASAEERSLVGASDVSFEVGVRGLGLVPVALRNAAALHPDFADAARRAFVEHVGI